MDNPARPPMTFYAEVVWTPRQTTLGDTVMIPGPSAAVVQAMPQVDVDALAATIAARIGFALS